ncbi:hypothetical protein Tco_0328750 [Tanacetum coccineum]
MYPSDFEDLYLLNLQGHLNHLSPEDKKILTTAVNLWTRNLVIRHRVEDFQLGIESYQTQLNLTKPRWEATGFEFKHDYTVIDSPRAVTFRDRYGVQMIMRFNEIHKFSDGTLQQIDEALDYRVKEFQINRTNPGMNTRFWTKKDVDRSKDFMFAIQKRLKTRRIFRNLESFVGGRIREGDYRTHNEDGNPSRANIKQALGNPVKEILFKMNLPDHRIKLWWKWRYLVLVESIHSPMLTLNVFSQRHYDNQKTYNTASATLISNVMIKKSMSMPVRKSQRHMKWGLMFISAAGQSLCCWIHTAEDLLLSKGKTGLESKDCLGRTKIQDYALWEVIENGNSWASVPQTAQENGTLVTKMSMPVTAEEKTNKKNDVKARSLAIMLFPMT